MSSSQTRNQVETVTVGDQLQATYTYDAKGNPVEVKDALNKVTRSEYDTLGRLRRVVHPSGIKEGYKYDSVGNRVEVTDGRLNSTRYDYNSLGWVTMVWDPLLNFTQYQYDSNGNQRKQIAANGLETTLRYDEQNRVNERVDSLGNSVKYSYDLAGNLKQMQDARGSMWSYAYRDNQWLDNIQVVNGTENYWVSYEYDRAGNRTQVEDPGNINKYSYDTLSRLTGVERNFDNGTYTTGYQYTQGLLTGIRYPETTVSLEYRYNGLNQLNEVVGFTEAGGIQYRADGALQSVAYANGVVTGYNYDEDRRLQSITAALGSANMLNLVYSYDDAGNIRQINDGKYDTTGNLIRTDIKLYEYDKNNQLTKAVTPGTFMENQTTAGTVGLAGGDFSGTSWLEFGLAPQAGLVCLDYNASSIGVDFGRVAPGVKKILLVPGAGYAVHRITAETFDVYCSNDNSNYSLISRDDWDYGKDEQGVITITFKQAKAMRYLKIHVWYDERNSAFFLLQDKATFLNQLGKMLQVYQEATSQTEEYEYDAAGNRKLTKVTLVQTEERWSWYYTNSDRLKTDGKFAFKYDEAGNLTEKGNKYSISGDEVNFTATSGEGVEYWDYGYDLLNRLVGVKKNGTLVSEYGYDPEGLRVVKRARGETIHYVFEGTEPFFEKNVTNGKVRSYVFALGKHLARVDGVIGDSEAEKYWYLTDHLGSVKSVTDDTGSVVFQADHLAFGQRYGESSTAPNFDEWHSFTGKEFDPDTGLYYFNARWYDQETGRFISEDPMRDPNNPNLYSYCANNPLNLIDPTGTVAIIDDDENGNPITDKTTYTPPSSTIPQAPNSTVSVSIDIPNYFPGVNVTFTYSSTTGEDGSKTSVTETRTYRKPNGGSVTISTVTIGNIVQTTYLIKDKTGTVVNEGTVTKITIIGLRGWGSGYTTPTMRSRGENPYDDSFFVATADGRIGFFDRVNLEGSTAEFTSYSNFLAYRVNGRSYYGTIAEGHDGTNPSIAEGTFGLNYGYHSGYAALWVNNNLRVNIEQAENPNPPTGRSYMSGVHIHKGGDGWNWSEGCLTVHESQWSGFMSYFNSNPNGVNNGKDAGTLIIAKI
jgi:RHS repeat-associated protein